jgi:hypothetical protein
VENVPPAAEAQLGHVRVLRAIVDNSADYRGANGAHRQLAMAAALQVLSRGTPCDAPVTTLSPQPSRSLSTRPSTAP